MQDNVFISVNKIGKSFVVENKSQEVLQNISFNIKKGEFACIIGPSGCGKSTLLRILASLEKPSSGSFEIKSKYRLSMVFQNFALFPWLTVEQNIGFGLKMGDVPLKTLNKIIHERIVEIGLDQVADKHPRELSGGMKQRVGIARALAVKPDILFLDEPFSSLDIFTANKLRADLLEIWKKNNLTVVMVSHLIEEAVELSDRVIAMTSSPGRVAGIVEINLPRPRQKRSENFYKYVDSLSSLIADR